MNYIISYFVIFAACFRYYSIESAWHNDVIISGFILAIVPSLVFIEIDNMALIVQWALMLIYSMNANQGNIFNSNNCKHLKLRIHIFFFYKIAF